MSYRDKVMNLSHHCVEIRSLLLALNAAIYRAEEQPKECKYRVDLGDLPALVEVIIDRVGMLDDAAQALWLDIGKQDQQGGAV